MKISNYIKLTKKHIDGVSSILFNLSNYLILRGRFHDQSKLCSPEVESFSRYAEDNITSTYGTQKYNIFLEEMSETLNHHYKNNRHHPEHFANGIQGMDLLDLLEMLADWKSSTLRDDSYDLIDSINIGQSRFNYSDELKAILINTAKRLYKYRVEWISEDGINGLYLSDSSDDIIKKILLDCLLTNSEKRVISNIFNKVCSNEISIFDIPIDNKKLISVYVQKYI